MRVIECQQGTDEWKRIRAGKVTASRICDVLAKIKSGEAAARRNYKAELACELLTGQPYPNGFTSPDMLRGTELEPLARAAYELHTGEMVDQVGFVQHPIIDQAGCSPDGLVGDCGGIEIKAPKLATHLSYLLAKGVPADYQPQIIWNLACTGREWWDFVSYCPELPEHLQLFIARMMADADVIADIEDKVRQFLKEINGLLIELDASAKVVTA